LCRTLCNTESSPVRSSALAHRSSSTGFAPCPPMEAETLNKCLFPISHLAWYLATCECLRPPLYGAKLLQTHIGATLPLYLKIKQTYTHVSLCSGVINCRGFTIAFDCNTVFVVILQMHLSVKFHISRTLLA
jgi:hypothetical protein